MPANAIVSILGTLAEARVRYVVVGGVAVVLHGHLRFTADLDLVLALDATNVLAALSALKTLGFQPRAPVQADQFADPAVRASWIREKGLVVFSLWSPSYPGTDVDIFAEEPIPFAELSARAKTADLPDLSVPIASIPHLIAMKRTAGRPMDLADIAALERIELSLSSDEET
ncbi:MAG: nucleotidyl transferase AbiEii/AbiGii toxin family protein [Thermoanaerobaculia bacterium]